VQQNSFSRTALRVAVRRAEHQVIDRPLILDDPWALRILPPDVAAGIRQDSTHDPRPYARDLRLFMAVRSRFAEDEFADAVVRGVRQYVALGAGLDTFAWRNPHVDAGVRVFEVDHPATQEWKRERIAEANLPEPEATIFVPVDFERESLAAGLAKAGFRTDLPAFFSWLGVVPYLTPDAFRHTLKFFGGLAEGSGVVFDYPLPREALDENGRRAFDDLSSRVASIGEPFRLALRPEEVATEFDSIGWRVAMELDAAGIRKRFFSGGEEEGANRGGMARLISAWRGR
jgi:methyltransferase (TIGR00027 family)